MSVHKQFQPNRSSRLILLYRILLAILNIILEKELLSSILAFFMSRLGTAPEEQHVIYHLFLGTYF